MSLFDKIIATDIVITLLSAIIACVFDDDTPTFIIYISLISFVLIPIFLIVIIWMS